MSSQNSDSDHDSVSRKTPSFSMSSQNSDSDYDTERDDSDYDTERDDEPEPVTLKEAAIADNKAAFIRLMGVVDPSSKEVASPEVMSLICSMNSFECAKAVIEGETGHVVDWSAPTVNTGLPPLHEEAGCHLTPQIELFLKHGAPPNLRCITDDKIWAEMLPINVALDELRNSKYGIYTWTTRQSAFNLIIRMCLPEMRAPLNTMKLLASKTEDIDGEIFYYAREGKVLELSALLLVAHERVLSPTLLHKIYGSDFTASTSLRQFITAEITLLTARIVRSEHNKNYQMQEKCEEMLVAMMHILHLLEIFERVGDQLVAYLKLKQESAQAEENIPEELLVKKIAEEVAWILKQAEFTLCSEDMDLDQCLLRVTKWIPKLKHVFYTSKYRFNADKLNLLVNSQENEPAEHDLPYCLQEDTLQPFQQMQNKKFQKEAVEDTDMLIRDEFQDLARPYHQWRFASMNHLSRSHRFSMYAFKKFDGLDDVSYAGSDGGGTKCDNGVHQLSTSIKKLRDHPYLRDWSLQENIFKLLFILCLPELKEELERIRLSARNCDKVGALGCSYAKGGKIIELAIILLVAREKLIPLNKSLSTDGAADEGMRISECILSEIQRSIDMEVRLMGRIQGSESIGICKNERVVFSSAWLLLDVFERAGDMFEKYFCSGLQFLKNSFMFYIENVEKDVAYDIAWMLKKLGFVLTDKDMNLNNLACFQSSFKPEPEELECLSKQIGLSISLEPHSVSPLKKTDGTYWQPSSSSHSSHAFNPIRSFHTVRIPKARPVLSSPAENHLNKVPIKYHPRVLNFPFGEHLVSFAMAIKRGLKRA